MAHVRMRAVVLGLAVLALVATAAVVTHQPPKTLSLVRATEPRTETAQAVAIPGPDRRAGSGILGSGTTCSYRGAVIACSDPSYGWWDSNDGCYWKLLSPQPPASSPLWLGNSPSKGSLYHRTCETDGGLGVGVLGNTVGFSSLPPPGYNGLAGTVDQLLALQAIVALGILGPIVSTAPAATGSGLVGLPVWMWQTPTLLTWGPIGLGVGLGPLGVGITALGAQVDWYMGDGHDVICAIGTAYSPTAGKTTSPNCGYAYNRPSSAQPGGHYTVTAAATWNVTWQVGIDTGSLTIVRATTTQITIHELQVVNQ